MSQKNKKKFVRLAFADYLTMLDFVSDSVQDMIEELNTYTFELELSLAIDKWQENKDVSGIIGLWCKCKFAPQLIGNN